MMSYNHLQNVLVICFHICSNMNSHPLHMVIIYSPNYFNNSRKSNLSLQIKIKYICIYLYIQTIKVHQFPLNNLFGFRKNKRKRKFQISYFDY